MKKAAMGVFALALLLVTGCGDSPDKVMKDLISVTNEAAIAYESATDKASAEKAKTKLEGLQKKAKDIVERMKKLKLDDPKDEKFQELMKKHADEMKKAGDRADAAKKKAMDNKEVQEVLKGIEFKEFKGMDPK